MKLHRWTVALVLGLVLLGGSSAEARRRSRKARRADGCCTVCPKKKCACGDHCIECWKQCWVEKGCACDSKPK